MKVLEAALGHLPRRMQFALRRAKFSRQIKRGASSVAGFTGLARAPFHMLPKRQNWR